MPNLSADKVREGLKLSLATGLRRNPIDALNPAWKTRQLSQQRAFASAKARARGADEVGCSTSPAK